MANTAQFKAGDLAFNGQNKRFYVRRETGDRREMLRFELDNPNRRSGIDRRRENNIWNNLHKS
ncbi:MAG: hypothetical protein OEW89_05715 [Gammaproteobacteria bacterium]|nr:hypothetical protein [Gammaproteobacteria bacterium]MDH5594954.1 hypothetical protein [Gammaproteobacteria bacterium]